MPYSVKIVLTMTEEDQTPWQQLDADGFSEHLTQHGTLQEAVASVSPEYINEEFSLYHDGLLSAHIHDGRLAALEFYVPMNDQERIDFARSEGIIHPRLFHLLIVDTDLSDQSSSPYKS